MPDFDRDLPVNGRVAFNIAASFDDFEPADVFDGFPGLGQGVLHGFLDRFGRGADDGKNAIDMICHVMCSLDGKSRPNLGSPSVPDTMPSTAMLDR